LKGRVAVKYSHWTEVEEKALEDAGSMGDLAEIALVILERMAKKKKPIVEICGPMSTGGFGNIKDNMELFEAMIDSATEHDLTVFNQVVFQDAMVRLLPKHSEHHYAWDILDIFYRRIFDSGLISEFLFSPNWYTSRGACWELLESLKVCINRRDYPVLWLPPIWQARLQPFVRDPLHSVVIHPEPALRIHAETMVRRAA
jgi:hypothetical protein